MAELNRRTFLTGLLVAPAIVRAGSLMPIRAVPPVAFLCPFPTVHYPWQELQGLAAAISETKWRAAAEVFNRGFDGPLQPRHRRPPQAERSVGATH